MKRLSAFALVLSLTTAALTGCGSSSSSSGSIFTPPPVQAATYSNASITGTYAVNFTMGDSNGIFTSSGTFTADGNGNISSGTLTEYSLGGNCTTTFTGTYTIQSDGSGTASAITTPGGASPCTASTTLQLVAQAAQQGQQLLLTESDGNAIATGIAAKR